VVLLTATGTEVVGIRRIVAAAVGTILQLMV
jgi:hypothetical protein